MSDNLPVAKPTLHRLQELMELRQQVETLESGTHWQRGANRGQLQQTQARFAGHARRRTRRG